ncbi:MAG: hypothetical protein K2K82_08765 [Muribaculaceae bacterium]|nr:hypothetical protein [Muribaculaceae bacterium]
MTVKELIEALSQYPEDMDVCVTDECGYGCSIDYVGENCETIYIHHYY